MDTFFWAIIGAVIALCIALTAYFIIGRADTRPIRQDFVGSEKEEEDSTDAKEGFYGGAVNGTSGLPCGRVSVEAEQLYAMFSSRPVTVGEEGPASSDLGVQGNTDLRDLKDLLSKLTCFKSDLMSPGQTITAVKELGFATHMDIQPVADLTGRCFAKLVPERDLSIQFEKWRDFGLDMIRRLCTASSMSELEASQAERLFFLVWNDVMSVAQGACLKGPPEGMFKTGPYDPVANTPDSIKELRPYDGLY
jgi:hypothetical protein